MTRCIEIEEHDSTVTVWMRRDVLIAVGFEFPSSEYFLVEKREGIIPIDSAEEREAFDDWFWDRVGWQLANPESQIIGLHIEKINQQQYESLLLEDTPHAPASPLEIASAEKIRPQSWGTW